MIEKLVFCTGYEIIYIILLNLFIGVFFRKRDLSGFKYWLFQILLVVINIALSLVFEDNVVIRQISVIGCNMLFSIGIFDIGLKMSFLICALFQSLGLFVEIISYHVLNSFFEAFAQKIEGDILTSYIMGYLCLFVIYLFVIALKRMFGKRMGVLLKNADWMRFLFFPIFSLVAIIAQIILYTDRYDRFQGYIFLVVDAGLLIMNVYILFLMDNILKREAKDAAYNLMMEKGKDDMEMYQSILTNYISQQKKAHEFKNHILCISALMKAGEYKELGQYIEKIEGNITVEGPGIIDTNNKLINVILNEKYKEAKRKDITFIFKVNDLKEICIEDIDIVVLLSNLINNAIEALENCSEKIIKLKFVVEHNQIVLAIGNNCERKPLNINDKYITTKNDATAHGYGISNIKEVIEKYDGEYNVNVNNGWFQFSIIIPNKLT